MMKRVSASLVCLALSGGLCFAEDASLLPGDGPTAGTAAPAGAEGCEPGAPLAVGAASPCRAQDFRSQDFRSQDFRVQDFRAQAIPDDAAPSAGSFGVIPSSLLAPIAAGGLIAGVVAATRRGGGQSQPASPISP